MWLNIYIVPTQNIYSEMLHVLAYLMSNVNKSEYFTSVSKIMHSVERVASGRAGLSFKSPISKNKLVGPSKPINYNCFIHQNFWWPFFSHRFWRSRSLQWPVSVIFHQEENPRLYAACTAHLAQTWLCIRRMCLMQSHGSRRFVMHSPWKKWEIGPVCKPSTKRNEPEWSYCLLTTSFVIRISFFFDCFFIL